MFLKQRDRDLFPEQEQEWNAIYASFRSRSIPTGTVIGVDGHTFDITGEDGAIQRRGVRSLVIIGRRHSHCFQHNYF